jgi:hypothetical protein
VRAIGLLGDPNVTAAEYRIVKFGDKYARIEACGMICIFIILKAVEEVLLEFVLQSQ